MPEQVFNFTGNVQNFTVPVWVSELAVELAGSQGNNSVFATGGLGGLVTATIPVVPGEVLSIIVGGRTAFLGAGGGGGGAGGTVNGASAADVGGRGGDYTIIRKADGTPYIIAGGGGGAGGTASTVATGSDGGSGGGLTAGPGENGASQPSGPGAGGGGGGTPIAGGAGGVRGGSSGSADPGLAGFSGAGGRGGNGLAGNFSETGGGGGGGLFGGGGGGAGSGAVVGGGGGGGGGSSAIYVAGIAGIHTQGARLGDGYIKLSWGSPQSAAPIAITPVSGAIVTTNTPTLGATLVAQGAARQRVEWHLATTSDFVGNLRIIAEPIADLKVSGVTTEVVPLANKLSQGVWYMRARTLDEGGAPSPFSVTQQFTVAHAPSATPVSPSSGQTVAYSTVGLSISWTFSDPSPDDSQLAYQVLVSDSVTGASVADTGRVPSLSKTANVLIPAASKNSTLIWRVRVWDQDDVAGNYSNPTIFTVGDAPTIVVDTMTTVATSAPTIGFTFTPVVAALATYRVTITKDSDGLLVYDSGWVNA